MANGIFKIPLPKNETLLNYGTGAPEKVVLKAEIDELKSKEIEIPLIIGGKEIKTGKLGDCRCPHDRKHLLGRYHKAGDKEVSMAVEASQRAWKEWSIIPWEARVSIFLKAAELLAGPWRATLNAATMLSQSKTVIQAEGDAVGALVDLWHYNSYFMQKIYEIQPESSPGIWNTIEWRPLEGFVFAVTPFNFISIAGNLPTSPALMGNTVLWKPASSGVYPAYFIVKLLQEAGLPDGVINFVPGSGHEVGHPVLKNEWFAGLHFTGSTEVFRDMWQKIGANIPNYRNYPRIVGETGGKDFIFAHPSADLDALAVATIRSAFEYQGQKCSAASRMYVPQSIWHELKIKLIKMVENIRVGNPEDFRNFMSAVIDKAAFDSITGYIEYARNSNEAEFLIGGTYDSSIGYFIDPTIIVTTNPKFKTMEEEIFGPVITVYVYPDNEFEETLQLCDETSPFALTGAIFAQARNAIETARRILTYSAGNFFINDRPSGVMIGHQPFGGGRASGTNDKAGSMMNLLRWISPRTTKENFLPPKNFTYPHMEEL
jgi:1-pyrroline-5-carboxylate dehydrogenase